MLGQNFGAGITSRELHQDAILMTSSYRQKCIWPALLTSLPMCGFIAQLVEHRTGIAEVTGSNPVEALIFFFFFFFFQASSFQLLKLENLLR